MACDGNRRGELNIIKRTHFTWGAGALSTAIWTGVPLCEILKELCPHLSAQYVWFQGSDELAKDCYATSIPLAFAMDPNNAVLLAYEMNDEKLPPDHGFPVRVVIPGHVGGRQVKWLSSILITDKECDNYYHLHDNKVLPPNVDVETSAPYWHKPEYVLYELNVNSVIVSPDHAECWHMRGDAMETRTIKGYAYSGGGRRISRVELSLDGGSSWEQCKLKNSCHEKHEKQEKQAGGEKTSISTFSSPRGPIRPYTGYKCFTFWLWELELPFWKLLHAKELVVRAVDEAMNIQPEQATWSVLGMMNNSWYRVKVFIETAIPPSNGEKSRSLHPALSFSHPIVPDGPYHGWMRPFPSSEHIRQALEAVSISRPTSGLKLHGSRSESGATAGEQHPRHQRRPAYWGGARPLQFTVSEVQEHATPEDCWIIIDREIYDLSPYLKEHPGGIAAITCVAGTDATHAFHQIHSHDAYEILGYYRIGSLAMVNLPLPAPSLGEEQPPSPRLRKSQQLANMPTEEEGILTVRRWTPFALCQVTDLTHDTKRFKFIPAENGSNQPQGSQGKPRQSSRDRSLGLPIGQHILISCKIEDQLVTRPYTPIAPARPGEDDGSFVLAVKIYRSFPASDALPHGRPGGLMSQHLASLQIGNTINVKGPAGPVHYLGDGWILNQGNAVKADRISMVAGGTGITPMFQLIRSLLDDSLSSSESTEVLDFEELPLLRLLFANRTEADIILKDDLDAMAKRHATRFQVHYTLSAAAEDWSGLTGYVTQPMLSSALFCPGPTSIVLLCGPPGMVEHSCVPYLLRLGFAPHQIIEF